MPLLHLYQIVQPAEHTILKAKLHAVFCAITQPRHGDLLTSGVMRSCLDYAKTAEGNIVRSTKLV